jgi:FkbM family methyltransferase
LNRNWTGILIEPVPSLYQTLLSKNRNVFSINCCIAKNRPQVAKFRVYNALSGREESMSDRHKKRIDKSSLKTKNAFKTVYVPCFSLNTILKALNVQKVDYFSLDVEGGEYDVLSSISFDSIDITTFTIEHNGETDRKNMMIDYLMRKNYELTKQDGQDIYFMKKKITNKNINKH